MFSYSCHLHQQVAFASLRPVLSTLAKMAFLRQTLFFLTIAVIATRNVAHAQDDFGQVLLEAFTTGMFDGDNSGQSQPGPVPTQTPSALGFPRVTLEPAVPDVSLEFETNTPEELGTFVSESPEGSWESSPGESPDATLEFNFFASPSPSFEYDLAASPAYTPQETAEETPVEPAEVLGNKLVETLEPISQYVEPSQAPLADPMTGLFDVSLASPIEDFDQFSSMEQEFITGTLTMRKPIRVNCGSFDDRNSFKKDVNKWFDNQSVAVEDKFASALFETTPEALLYSTYRYSANNLTYTVPIQSQGMWRVTLQWAEIDPAYMDEGARVFTVSFDSYGCPQLFHPGPHTDLKFTFFSSPQVEINGIERDASVDVYRDSPAGKYSPLVRTYVVDVIDSSIVITLAQKVGEPMLSAFQATHISPFTN